MNPTPDPNAASIAQAEGKLARLGVQVEAMQAVLVRLLQDVIQAEHRLDQSQTAQLVEANEQLVLAALASQTEAETVTQALLDAATPEHRFSQLREANEQLVVSAVGAQELQAAAEQAQQRQAAFLAAVADELRNPVAPIRIATAMLGRQPADEPLLARVQGIVAQQMTHMARLVDAANGAAGGLHLDRLPVDLAQVIDAAVAAHRRMLGERRQRFECQRPAGALVVHGDAPAVHQIVGNLLDNASKHTHDGGRIGLSVAVDAEALVMTVSDDGIGITPAMLHHVFEPFVQDTHALGFNGDGLGIGLTVVRALVQAHGGTLTAHSAGIGCGSEFVVTLPRALGVQEAAGAVDAAGPGR